MLCKLLNTRLVFYIGHGCKQRPAAGNTKVKPNKCDNGAVLLSSPCVKPAKNTKKHFIIHTPERDKVIIMQQSFFKLNTR